MIIISGVEFISIMISTLIIAGITCISLISSILFFPEIRIKKISLPIYPFIAFIGAILMIIFSPLNLKDCVNGIAGSGAVNPLKILTLFLSITAISVFLDEAGLFEFLANKVLNHAGTSQVKLFFLLYASVSVLTIFTSNDIIILTFTPFIIYFCRSAKIKALPYLIAEFVAANTWSMALIIGNPTNIYLATSIGIDFFYYIEVMIVPTILTGVISCLVLFLLFRKSLREPFYISEENKPQQIMDKPLCILGAVVLLICIVSLAISNYIHVEMYIECLICLGVLILTALLLCLIRHKNINILGHTLKRLPYELIPFILSMFVISLGLDKAGISQNIAKLLSNNELILYGSTSFLASNLVNNIPMSVIYSSIISAGEASNHAVFASIIGSNLGALLTPVGALAGIMFSSYLKKHGEKFSALTFIKYGSIISVVSLVVSLSSLYLMLLWI